MQLLFLLAVSCWSATFKAPSVTVPGVARAMVVVPKLAAPPGAVALTPLPLLSPLIAPAPLVLSAAPQLDLTASLGSAAAAPNVPVDSSRGLSGIGFDGPIAPSVPVDGGIAPAPAHYLVVADPVDRAWLALVVEAAQASPTALRVLKKVERQVERQGRPILVRFGPTGLGGDYHYDWETVGIDKRNRKDGPFADVATLIHELQHVLQKPQGLPSGAFELELEAYLVDFKVSRELGFIPTPGSYDARAQEQFKKDLGGFIAWLLNEYKDNTPLIGSTMAVFKERLIKERRLAIRGVKRWTKELAARQAILDLMVSTQQRPEAIAAYRGEAVDAAAEHLRLSRVRLAWAERDLALLADPAGRARYQSFAKKVYERAKRYQKQYFRDPS